MHEATTSLRAAGKGELMVLLNRESVLYNIELLCNRQFVWSSL
jgi:hypothetical protein